MRVTVKDAETGNRIEMELETDNTVEETIESAATYWAKDPGAYVLKFGRKILRGSAAITEVGLREQDYLELIPDPEGGAGLGPG